jgi:hypothetical protein
VNEPQLDIDRLVREVLAQLGAGATGDSSAADEGRERNDKAGAGVAQSHAGTEKADGEFVLSCRVVTVSEVAGRLGTMRRLVVPARAVVTPAVRDELRRRDIRLVYAAPAPAAAGYTVRLCLLSVGRPFEPAPLAAALAAEGVEMQAGALDCLLAATDRLALEVVQEGTLGLLLTEHTAAALCLANRRRGVRAILGADAAAVAAAAAAVGANLLVVDPAATGSFPLKQMAAEFCRGGTRRCPEVFRERLR